MTVTTPTIRRVARNGLFWVVALVFVLLVGFATIALTAAGTVESRLAPTNPGPAGTQAVAEVLRQNGVSVTATTTLGDTEAAATSAEETTIAFYDESMLLDASALGRLSTLADRLVLLDPSLFELETIIPDVLQAGSVSGLVRSDCALPAVQRAGEVSGEGSGYRLADGASGEQCLGSGDGIYSLIRIEAAGTAVTVLGAADALTNEHVIEYGNAALALGILGETRNLVWYLPSLADLAGDQPPTFADLSPAWVTPVIALLSLVALAAIFWRGRRLGPLVIENLPVVVRASETMEGRARLYEKGSARLRALDALRIGAIERLARLCGLPRLASVDEVASAVASITSRQLHDVRELLIDAQPTSDAALVRLSDALLELERAVADATRPA